MPWFVKTEIFKQPRDELVVQLEAHYVWINKMQSSGAATGPVIKIWDLESKVCVDELKPDDQQASEDRSKKAMPIQCISLAWSADGTTLFAGYTDNLIRVWQVDPSQSQ
eukprot:gb/GEZN01027518.1/.p1 GENE.gb/GEZN01027518.1/~~gb/GEZN01027518.1/.p1  ORF type:complete len:109 (-),score=13.59 gb/GEZN01027518.1/:27-353(-)